MAIIGAHALLYTSEPEALRATLRDVFGWKHVDAGGGWLIFALPPAELGVHPAEGPTYESGVRHQLTFMCDDIHRTIRDLRSRFMSLATQLAQPNRADQPSIFVFPWRAPRGGRVHWPLFRRARVRSRRFA
jgi:hypothetical protein